MTTVVLTVKNLAMAYDTTIVQKDVSFSVNKSEIMVIMGDSGSGKSTLLKHLIGLARPTKGSISYFGENYWELSDEQQELIKRKFGVTFQSGALWSSMSLRENIALPLKYFTRLSKHEIADIVEFKLALVNLSGFENYYPAELSGGMQKRAALARALVLDPEILFFDEPSAGLDPISAKSLDDLILQIRDSLQTTIIVVTHELASIFTIADRAVFLDGELHEMTAVGNPKELLEHSRDKKILRFLSRGIKGVEDGKTG